MIGYARRGRRRCFSGRGCNSRRLHKEPLTIRRKWLFLLKFRRLLSFEGRGFQPAALQFHASKAYHRKQLATRALGCFFRDRECKQGPLGAGLAAEIADNMQTQFAL